MEIHLATVDNLMHVDCKERHALSWSPIYVCLIATERGLTLRQAQEIVTNGPKTLILLNITRDPYSEFDREYFGGCDPIAVCCLVMNCALPAFD